MLFYHLWTVSITCRQWFKKFIVGSAFTDIYNFHRQQIVKPRNPIYHKYLSERSESSLIIVRIPYRWNFKIYKKMNHKVCNKLTTNLLYVREEVVYISPEYISLQTVQNILQIFIIAILTINLANIHRSIYVFWQKFLTYTGFKVKNSLFLCITFHRM